MAPVSSRHVFIPSVKFVAMFVVAASLFQVVTSDSWCTSRSCGDNQVCCGSNGCIVGSNCLGLYCSSRSDCFVGESCCNSKCSNTSSCLGYFCNYDSDCSIGQSCCSNECRDSPDCVGYFCTSTSDCDHWESCCYGTCSKLECFSPIPTIAVTYFNDNNTFIIATILGSLGFGFIVALVVFICRRQRPAPVRVATSQEGAHLFTSPIEHPAQIYRPLPGQVPPSYQQGYPYYPPPQYEQHRTDKPQNAAATKASEQLPPNNGTVEASSGGVHPQNTYGALPSASNLPV